MMIEPRREYRAETPGTGQLRMQQHSRNTEPVIEPADLITPVAFPLERRASHHDGWSDLAAHRRLGKPGLVPVVFIGFAEAVPVALDHARSAQHDAGEIVHREPGHRARVVPRGAQCFRESGAIGREPAIEGPAVALLLSGSGSEEQAPPARTVPGEPWPHHQPAVARYIGPAVIVPVSASLAMRSGQQGVS